MCALFRMSVCASVILHAALCGHYTAVLLHCLFEQRARFLFCFWESLQVRHLDTIQYTSKLVPKRTSQLHHHGIQSWDAQASKENTAGMFTWEGRVLLGVDYNTL